MFYDIFWGKKFIALQTLLSKNVDPQIIGNKKMNLSHDLPVQYSALVWVSCSKNNTNSFEYHLIILVISLQQK